LRPDLREVNGRMLVDDSYSPRSLFPALNDLRYLRVRLIHGIFR